MNITTQLVRPTNPSEPTFYNVLCDGVIIGAAFRRKTGFSFENSHGSTYCKTMKELKRLVGKHPVESNEEPKTNATYIEIRHNYDSELNEARGRVSRKFPIMACLIQSKSVADVLVCKAVSDAQKKWDIEAVRDLRHK